VVYGLLRNEDMQRYQDSDETLMETFHDLVGSNWNDDLDSNGWNLTHP